MKLKKVQNVKKKEGGHYYKYMITPVPNNIAEESGLIDKPLKAKIEKGKIIIEKE